MTNRRTSSRFRCLLVVVLLLGLPASAIALQAPDRLDALDEREAEVLEAIAARPPALREAALVASQHPDALVRSELIQARSSAAFELRVERLDREHQEELWELVREPGAIAELTAGGVKAADSLEEIAARYPESVRDPIRHLGADHFETLQEVEAIQAAADIEFEESIASLPEPSREAFQQLLADPELMVMLARSPSAVVALGEAFAADPDATRARVDTLAVEVAAANELVENEWRDGLAEDPDAQAELEVAAREYADEYGYDYDALTTEQVVVEKHYYHPYPYWFGYPSWYAFWYPWGVWYPVYPHVGFYYGGRYGRVYYGLPSLHFVHWFYGGHHHRYGHVKRHFDHRRHGHRRSSHAVYRSVRRHERHVGSGKHRHGSPRSIRGRSFRGRDRSAVEERRSEFRSRGLRTPEGAFGRAMRGDRMFRRNGNALVPDGTPRRDEPRAEGQVPVGDRGRADSMLGRSQRATGERNEPSSGTLAKRRRADRPGVERRASARRETVETTGTRSQAPERTGGAKRSDRVVRPDVVTPRVVRPKVVRRESNRSALAAGQAKRLPTTVERSSAASSSSKAKPRSRTRTERSKSMRSGSSRSSRGSFRSGSGSRAGRWSSNRSGGGGRRAASGGGGRRGGSRRGGARR